MNNTDELSTQPIGPLMTARQLAELVPISAEIRQHITASRQKISQILSGSDPRLLVIIGPCSIHDLQAALDYAGRLQVLRKQYQSRLEIVMRAYFEKPRTITGWQGLINDPYLDGSHDINHGLRIARQLLSDINRIGMPVATEFLDIVTGHYIADLISWGRLVHAPPKVRFIVKWLQRFTVRSDLKMGPMAIFRLPRMPSERIVPAICFYHRIKRGK